MSCVHYNTNLPIPQLIEIVMDLGRVPLARFPEGDFLFSDMLVTENDLLETLDLVYTY